MSEMMPRLYVAPMCVEMNNEMQISHMKVGDKMKSKMSDIDKGKPKNKNDEDLTTVHKMLDSLKTAIDNAEEAKNNSNPDLITTEKAIATLKLNIGSAIRMFKTEIPLDENIKTEVQEVISNARKIRIELMKMRASQSYSDSEYEAWRMKMQNANEKKMKSPCCSNEYKQTPKTDTDEKNFTKRIPENLNMMRQQGVTKISNEDKDQMSLEETSYKQRFSNVTDDNGRSSVVNERKTRGGQEKMPWCRICVRINAHDKNHRIPDCKTLNSLDTTKNKLDFVKKHKICKICFKNNNSSHACERVFKCSSHKMNLALCGCQMPVIYMHSINFSPIQTKDLHHYKGQIKAQEDEVIEGKILQPKTRSIETQTDFIEVQNATNTEEKAAQTKKKRRKPKKKKQTNSTTQQVDIYKPHEVEKMSINNDIKMDLINCFKIIPKWTIWILIGMSIVGLLMKTTETRIMQDESVLHNSGMQKNYRHLMNFPNCLHEKLSLKNLMKLKQLDNENEFIALVLNSKQVKLTEELDEQKYSENDCKYKSQADMLAKEVKQQTNLSLDDTISTTKDEMKTDDPDIEEDYMRVTDENVLQNLKIMLLTL